MKQRKRDRLSDECRALWEQFDPIGLSSFPGRVAGEYDGYLSQTIELVIASADEHRLVVTHVATKNSCSG